jgi:hypothetical protein
MKSLYAAMLDPDLFGATFSGPTFEAWRTVAKMLDGLPLTESETALYQLVTHRTDAPSSPFTEAYLVKPRRAGGTLFAAAVGLHAALGDYVAKLGPGEIATVALIASDRKQARQLLNYVRGLIEASPMIKGEVETETQESISFAHRVRLEVHTTSFRSTRGYSYAAVVLDELAYFRDDLSANPDVELIRAVRPGLATLNGRLLGLSSPHARRGHLFDMHRQYFGIDGANVLIVQASHSVLNPTIDPKIIERAMADDPEAARSEWFGEFRSDISQYLSEELLVHAIDDGVVERPYSPSYAYVAFCDPSGGSHDAMTLGIAHAERGDRTDYAVLDQVLIVQPPFEPEDVVKNFCALLQRFNIRFVTGDRYGGEWVASMFKKWGIRYEPSELDKSAIYTESLPLFAQKRVELLDIRKLSTELRLLERSPRAGGRGDSVDHPPRAHDDAANAAIGALRLASLKSPMIAGQRLSRPQYSLT